MKISKNFLKDIPIEKKEFVLQKVQEFNRILLSIKDLSEIPNGFWVRKIAGTDIYKFRVNNGDRVLFKYNEFTDDNEKIIFIAYKKHDDQIRAGRNYNYDENRIEFLNLEIETVEYIDDETDFKLDDYIKSEVYKNINNIKNTSLLEDEYISMSVEEKEYQYLSEEQFECLNILNNPVMIFGCAGSGKTLIGVRRLLLNERLNIKSLYLTCSTGIRNKTKEIYHNCKSTEKNIKFCTFKEICEEILNLKQVYINGYEEFYKFLYNNSLVNGNESIRLLWSEINSILKGCYINNEMNIMSLDFYLNFKGSSLNEIEKRKVYKIAQLYNIYLKNNNIYDLNDLAFKCINQLSDEHKYEYIVFDEVQELTEKQLKMLELLVLKSQNLMLLGDLNQSINISKFSLNFVKNLIFYNKFKLEEKCISKNYRNTNKVIYWINNLKGFRSEKFKGIGEIGLIKEVPVKVGEKPKVFYGFNIEKEFINFISNDPECAIIVAEDSVKQEFFNKDCLIDRLFTIEEIRGLEYKNIYCYNLIENFNSIYEVLKSNEKCADMYSIYFNMLYIAATRSTFNLIFLEKEASEISSIFNEYWEMVSSKNNLIQNVKDHVDKEKWLIEANRLELLGQFEKAAAAYDKIGMFSDKEICLDANKKMNELLHLQKNKTYILIQGTDINYLILNNIISYFYKQINVKFDKYLEINSFYDEKLSGKCERIYIEQNEDINVLAKKIHEIINKEYLLKNRIVLKVALLKNDTRIENYFDYLLTYDTVCENFNIERCILTNIRLMDDIIDNTKNEFFGKIGFNPDNEATKLRMKSKYDEMAADSILDFIFNEKY